MTFFTAGQDTTSQAINMCVFEISRNPLILETLRLEIAEKVPDLKNINYESLSKMHYLTAIIKEGFRIYLPVQIFMPRIATKDFRLGNLQIKKNTIIECLLGNKGFHDDYFENPKQFNPDRWLVDGKIKELDDPFVILPFWAGARNCIGQHFAWIVLRLIIVILFANYDVTITSDPNLKMTNRFLYEPFDPIMATFKKRQTK